MTEPNAAADGRPPGQRAAAARSGRPPTPRTVGEMRSMAQAFLERRGVEEARLEADLLVAHALGVDRLGLLMKLEAPVLPAEVDQARDLLVRRGRHEPVAYITGTREFYGRSFLVGPGALVPRPESELLVDLARSWARSLPAERQAGPLRLLDLGTGSGCLAATLALELETAEVVAVDRSRNALGWAQRNLEALELTERVELVEADGLEALEARMPFDLVVSNPPYVNPADAPGLAPDVREFEPSEALFAPGQDLDFWVRELIQRVPQCLAPQGSLLVELGFDQCGRMGALGESAGVPVRLHQDLAGIERVLQAVRPGEDWPVDQPRTLLT